METNAFALASYEAVPLRERDLPQYDQSVETTGRWEPDTCLTITHRQATVPHPLAGMTKQEATAIWIS